MKKKSVSRPGFFTLRITIALFVCIGGIWSLATGTAPAFLRAKEPVNGSQRILTFEERVSYQRAIEEVYWRHRIWPNERRDPKPSLDAVVSQAQIEKKVTDYLRKSQALEDYWQRPITADQLQAEMDRMAQHTRQPEVLRELFEALGNDPFVIAECLARPALAERLLTNWFAYDQRIHGEIKQRAEAELQASRSRGIEQMKRLSGEYHEIEFLKRDGPREEAHNGPEHGVTLASHEWDETVQKLAATVGHEHTVVAGVAPAQPTRLAPQKTAPAGAASAREDTSITQIKTGVLSSLQEDEDRFYVTRVIQKTKDRLKLATVAWSKESLESWLIRAENVAPDAASATDYYNLPTISGEACADDSWTATSGPPDGRVGHTAVWTGSEMIVWGGAHANQTFFNTGGRYNPSTDNWTPTSANNSPTARAYHTAVWTGSEIVVWGGYDGTELNTGARYDPITDDWTGMSTANAPSARSFHTAVWDGNEMIVWGGYASATGELNTGGKYDPSADTWEDTSTVDAPAARYSQAAVWTGSEMIVWGGENSGLGLNTGGKYDPVTNSWTLASVNNAPIARYGHTAVWSGMEMIVWGGYDVDNQQYLNSGGKYNPITDNWTATSITNAPESRSNHTAVWTGSEMIVWGGSFFDNGYFFLNTGGRYNPASNSWVATSIIDSPGARESHTAIWTGSEMIIWGGSHFGYFNTGGRYKPATDSWLPTGGTPDQRGDHTAVWTGTEVLLWGGNNATGYFNTGGKYVPSTDTWMTTTTMNAPTSRSFHTAVWSGTEMIVWGGFSDDGIGHYWNTGGRYNPTADSWSATNVTNAPIGRDLHTAVWTGTEMVIWGGASADPPQELATGGRYSPGTDSWTATTTTNAPSARASHTAVWTGNEMIVWGGTLDSSGGRYDPSIDGWTATTTTNAPSGRLGSTAVWTGNEMIVWGGYFFDGLYHYLNTGGGYNPNTDSWTTTAITNVPDGRSNHTAVWTGTEMIIWGGEAGDDPGYFFNTGGRYDPIMDNWITTNTISAPDGRFAHTAVWTGNEMVVWGGIRYPNAYTGTGGMYCAQSGPPPTPTPTPTPCTGRCGPTPRPRPNPHVRPSPR